MDLAGSEEVLEDKKTSASLAELGDLIQCISKKEELDLHSNLVQTLTGMVNSYPFSISLLCCCSARNSYSSESLSTLLFGARASCNEETSYKKIDTSSEPGKDEVEVGVEKPARDESVSWKKLKQI